MNSTKMIIVTGSLIIDYLIFVSDNRLIDKFHLMIIVTGLLIIDHLIFVCYFTIFTLSIQTHQPFTILYLKFEQVEFTTQCCV